jgi:hypothetical protein
MNTIRQLLCNPKPTLPHSSRKVILAQGHDAGAELIAVLQDKDLQISEDDGESMASIHAARLLGELRSEAAIPALLAALMDSEPGLILWDAALFALAEIGPPVLEPALALVPDATPEHRGYLVDVLSRLKVPDARVLALLLEELRTDPESGAMYLGHYADPASLPDLIAAFDAMPLDEGNSLFANQGLVELKASIDDAGGHLTPAQLAKYDLALAPRLALRDQMHGFFGDEPEAAKATPSLPQQPVRAVQRPGRNDPCWCGAGRKYKKCHLVADGG